MLSADSVFSTLEKPRQRWENSDVVSGRVGRLDFDVEKLVLLVKLSQPQVSSHEPDITQIVRRTLRPLRISKDDMYNIQIILKKSFPPHV